jgi:hypothetical protein
MRRINKYLPISIQNYFFEKKEFLIHQKEFNEWKLKGCPVPPPHAAKQEKIEELARLYRCETFIETGTYLGDTIYSQRKNFKRLISIELSERLYKAAARRFRSYPEIEICHGNSGDILARIMSGIKTRALLWLNGHYSGGITAKGKTESPVYRELDAVFSNNDLRHIIMIDDARLFIGKRDYPTFEELKDFIQRKNPEYWINVDTDIIILTI